MKSTNFLRSIRLLAATAAVSLLAACAHPISLEPTATPTRGDESTLIAKKVGYVMTDVDRSKEVTTPGGGGDKVTYYPYRDMEKSIREALRSVYADVVVLRSANDQQQIANAGVSYVFTPQISTTSSSPSPFTWPPTRFDTELSCSVTDAAGAPVAQVKASGVGTAEFDEFKKDVSLSARRSTQDAAEKLAQEIRRHPQLK